MHVFFLLLCCVYKYDHNTAEVLNKFLVTVEIDALRDGGALESEEVNYIHV